MSRSLPLSRWALAWAVVIVGGGVALRLARLHEGFWIDEVISVDIARRSWQHLLSMTGFSDVHPPLYYAVLKVWSAIAGPSDAAGRLLSVLFSAAALALFFGWVRRRQGLSAALFAGLYLALSTFHLHYSVEVRSYSLLVLETVALLWAYERWLERPAALGRLLVIALLEAAALWTHYYAALWLILLNLHFFFGRHPARAAASWWATAQLGVLASFAPWLPILLVQVFHLPAVITAHLTATLPPSQVVLAFGPAPAGALPGLGVGAGVLFLLAAVWGALRPWAPNSADGQVPRPLSRGVVGACLIGVVVLPLTPLWLLTLSELTFELLTSELPRAYGFLAGGAAALGIGVAVSRRIARTIPWSLPAVLVIGAPALILLLNLFRPSLFIRNLLFLLPPAIALAAHLVSRRPLVAHLTTWLVLPLLAIPSILAAPEGFQPRQDFAGLADAVADAGTSPVYVLPAWDAPGLERYVHPNTRVMRLPDAQSLPPAPELPNRLDVVLTRQAARDVALRADVLAHLVEGAGLRLSDERTLRGLWGGIRLLRFSR